MEIDSVIRKFKNNKRDDNRKTKNIIRKRCCSPNSEKIRRNGKNGTERVTIRNRRRAAEFDTKGGDKGVWLRAQ